MKTRRSLANYCHGQKRLNLGKIYFLLIKIDLHSKNQSPKLKLHLPTLFPSPILSHTSFLTPLHAPPTPQVAQGRGVCVQFTTVTLFLLTLSPCSSVGPLWTMVPVGRTCSCAGSPWVIIYAISSPSSFSALGVHRDVSCTIFPLSPHFLCVILPYLKYTLTEASPSFTEQLSHALLWGLCETSQNWLHPAQGSPSLIPLRPLLQPPLPASECLYLTHKAICLRKHCHEYNDLHRKSKKAGFNERVKVLWLCDARTGGSALIAQKDQE